MSTLEHLAYDDGQAEIALLRRMQRGERDALTALYQRYERRLYAFCHRMVGNPDDAADLVQETFLRVIRRLPELDVTRLNLSAYLHTTARNLFYKQAERAKRVQLEERMEDVAPAADVLEEDPERAALLGAQQVEVRDANMRLAPRQRMVLALRELEDRSYAEIGEILGMNENAVAQLISRARIRLREELRMGQIDRSALSPETQRLLPTLAAYCDGQLKGEKLAAVEAALAESAECRAVVDAFGQASKRYRALLPAVPLVFLGEEVARAAEAAGLVHGNGAASDPAPWEHDDASQGTQPREAPPEPGPAVLDAGRRPHRARPARRRPPAPAVAAARRRARAAAVAGTRGAAASWRASWPAWPCWAAARPGWPPAATTRSRARRPRSRPRRPPCPSPRRPAPRRRRARRCRRRPRAPPSRARRRSWWRARARARSRRRRADRGPRGHDHPAAADGHRGADDDGGDDRPSMPPPPPTTTTKNPPQKPPKPPQKPPPTTTTTRRRPDDPGAAGDDGRAAGDAAADHAGAAADHGGAAAGPEPDRVRHQQHARRRCRAVAVLDGHRHQHRDGRCGRKQRRLPVHGRRREREHRRPRPRRVADGHLPHRLPHRDGSATATADARGAVAESSEGDNAASATGQC